MSATITDGNVQWRIVLGMRTCHVNTHTHTHAHTHKGPDRSRSVDLYRGSAHKKPGDRVGHTHPADFYAAIAGTTSFRRQIEYL